MLTFTLTGSGEIFNLAYDDNGNLVSKTSQTTGQATTYTWNARNWLTAITGPGLTASFAYDALGRRIEKTVNGQSVGFLYDGSQVIAELAGSTVNVKLLSGIAVDEMLARYTAAGARHYLTDALGSVVAMLKEDASVQNYYGYSPYGETTPSANDDGNSSEYTGRENDLTGVYYYRARYFDPVLKRFISADPIGLGGGVNFYGYVGGNPVSYVDPLGLNGSAAWLSAHLHVGNTDYGYFSANPNANGRLASLIGGRKSNKCNFFVNDSLTAGGNPPGRMADGRIPSASEWTDPKINIPGYYVLPVTAIPKAGDIVAYEGHVGLANGTGGTISASGTEQKVVDNDWGFRNGQTPTIRRCECDR